MQEGCSWEQHWSCMETGDRYSLKSTRCGLGMKTEGTASRATEPSKNPRRSLPLLMNKWQDPFSVPCPTSQRTDLFPVKLNQNSCRFSAISRAEGKKKEYVGHWNILLWRKWITLKKKTLENDSWEDPQSKKANLFPNLVMMKQTHKASD